MELLHRQVEPSGAFEIIKLPLDITVSNLTSDYIFYNVYAPTLQWRATGKTWRSLSEQKIFISTRHPLIPDTFFMPECSGIGVLGAHIQLSVTYARFVSHWNPTNHDISPVTAIMRILREVTTDNINQWGDFYDFTYTIYARKHVAFQFLELELQQNQARASQNEPSAIWKESSMTKFLIRYALLNKQNREPIAYTYANRSMWYAEEPVNRSFVLFRSRPTFVIPSNLIGIAVSGGPNNEYVLFPMHRILHPKVIDWMYRCLPRRQWAYIRDTAKFIKQGGRHEQDTSRIV